jgi:hypothetical protein
MVKWLRFYLFLNEPITFIIPSLNANHLLNLTDIFSHFQNKKFLIFNIHEKFTKVIDLVLGLFKVNINTGIW